MINWDQRSMFALQLTYALRHKVPDAAAVQALLEQIVDEHAKARVDRAVQCVFALSRGTVPAGFRSFERDPIPDRLYEDVPSGMQALEDAGGDLIQILLDRSRRDGIEFLGGLRMNDRHATSTPFHAAHPDWQLPEYAGGMDYKHAGVREAVLDFVAEFLDRLLGVRIPQTLEECRSLGYDVAAWIRSGDIDFICPSDFFFTDFNSKTEDFVRLTEGTACRVYPSLHPLISWGNDHQVQSRESYRAAANNILALGAHGISAYNYQYHWRPDKGREENWPGVLDYLAHARELSEIEQGDRQYLFHPMWSGHGGGIGPSGKLRDVRIVLARENRAQGSLDLRLAEDLQKSQASASLTFKVTGLAPEDELQVNFNGESLTSRPYERQPDADGQSVREGRVLPAFDLFRFALTPADVRFGDNRLAVALGKSGGSEPAIVQEVEVLVRVAGRGAR